MWDRRAKVLSVHDGDTLTVVLDQGFGQMTQITLCLFGVFAPELTQSGGKEATEYVKNWLASFPDKVSEWPIIVTTMRTPQSDTEVQTMGRYVGVVESLDHTHNLNVEAEAYYTSKGFLKGIGGPKVAEVPAIPVIPNVITGPATTAISTSNPTNTGFGTDTK